MWKIVFVEDEPFVRRSIIQQIDWEAKGFEIVGEADDGVEALEQIKSLKPDLIISDIIMPNMNGLELLHRSKELGFEGLFIMLTAMNEFEYARQALEYGAFGYELKLSMSPDSIHKMLDKVNAELSRKELVRAKVDYQQAYETIWYLLVVQSGNPEHLEPNQSRLWEGSRYRYVSICSVLHGDQPFDRQQYMDWFGLEDGIGSDLHIFHEYGVTSCFNWSDRPFKLKQLQPAAIDWPVICSGVTEVSQFPKVWMHVLRQLNSHWYKGRPGLFWLNDNHEEPRTDEPLNWKLEMELYELIDAGKSSAAIQLLSTAWNHMEHKQASWMMVKDTAFRIARWLQQKLPSLVPRLPQQITDSSVHSELFTIMREAVEYYIKEHPKESYPTTDHPEINAVLQYIHKHYHENLTLKALAKQINMDEKYLSGLFVRKMGEPLVQYLQHIRVEKAKELLIQTSMPVNEIGEQVGFANANYFFKIFKRWSNMTPNDYRKLNR